jgi:hypothetical protein
MTRGNLAMLCALVLGAVALAGCADDEPTVAAKGTPPPPPVCPTKLKQEYQRLANRVRVPVYCPTWMPSPLDGDIKGPWENGVSVKKDRSYLVSFLWHEPPAQDVHVNLRGYPGRSRVPMCEDTQVVAGKTRRREIPCFSDARPVRTIGRRQVTPYTVNQGVDQWHVLYLWREGGNIYTLSEHVAKPLTYRHVVRNLDRMMRRLVRVEPTSVPG